MARRAGDNFGPESFSPRQLPLRSLEKPQGDVVHLWHLDFSQLTNPMNQETRNPSRKLSAFQQTATRRFYLRLLLGAYLGLPGKDIHIERRIKGRPELDAEQSHGELNFSVARSNDCYLIGISSGNAIGVDLEVASRKSGKPLALARRYFSEAEFVALSALGEEELHRAFMYTWSCKEAIVKANGLGIANQLCRFTVDVNPDNPPSVLDMPDDDSSAWKLAVAEPAKGAIAVVAARQPDIQIQGFNLS
mgnify:CR=1 FL=1